LRAQLEAMRNKQAQDSRPDNEPEPMRRGASSNYFLDDSEDGYVEEIYAEIDEEVEEGSVPEPDEEDDIITFEEPSGKDEL